MWQKHHKKLIIRLLIVCAMVVIVSYLFHSGLGQFSVTINGEPVAEPLVRFAVVPTFLLVMIIAGALMVLLFLGFGVFMFLLALVMAVTGIFILAPYFWPVLIIILIMITLMTVANGKKE